MGYRIENRLGQYFDVDKEKAEAGEIVTIGFLPGDQDNAIIGVYNMHHKRIATLPIRHETTFKMPAFDIALELCAKDNLFK